MSWLFSTGDCAWVVYGKACSMNRRKIDTCYEEIGCALWVKLNRSQSVWSLKYVHQDGVEKVIL